MKHESTATAIDLDALRALVYKQTHGEPPDRASLPGSDDKWEGYQLGVEEALAVVIAFLTGPC